MRYKYWLLIGGLLLSGGALAGVHESYQAPDDAAAVANVDPATLNAADMITRSRQMLAQMNTTQGRIVAIQKRAENKKDMVMVNCASDKLVQVKGYVSVGTQAAAALELAAGQGNNELRMHNFERQTIVYQKVLVLGTEAEGCAGEDVSYTGATTVDVDIDPSIPETDPTIPPAGVAPSAGRPPEATPFA